MEPADLASLRDVYTGGAACPEDVRQRFLERFGRPVYTTYGLTEAPSVVAIDPLDDPSPPGASGRPLPHLDVSFEPTGRDDAGGEIVVGAVPDGPWAGRYQPFLGYWNRPDTPVPVAEGRLHTGDVGRMEDGRLVVVDRLGSVIIRGGANVYPAEVERVLRTLPTVADAVVVGLPDERLGETVHALVELEAAQTTTERALVDGCLNQLARYKVPVRILVVDAIDRNALGKPDQRTGRERGWRRSRAAMADDTPRRFQDRITHLCDAHPDAPVIEFETHWTTWGDVSRRMRALHSALQGAGLGPGDAVGLVVRERPPAVSALLALLAEGRPVVLIQSLASDDELCADVARLPVGAVVAESGDWDRDRFRERGRSGDRRCVARRSTRRGLRRSRWHRPRCGNVRRGSRASPRWCRRAGPRARHGGTR